MSKYSNVKLIYLTVGEIPSKTNLIYSQVIKMASHIKKLNIFNDVDLISIIPKRTILASYIRRKPASFKWYKTLDLNAQWFSSFMVINSMLAFIFKKNILKYDAKKIVRMYNLKKDFSYVIHCRSYLAADIAIIIRDMYPSINIKVLFDMRSILPPELYYTMGRFGDYFFVNAKKWERKLLYNADLSLLSTDRGLEYIKLESPFANLKKINILGFDSNPNTSIEGVFQKRWEVKTISYIGSIGLWHPLSMVEDSLFYIKQVITDCTIEIASGNALGTKIPRSHIDHKNMAEYYNKLLAIVIPGKVPETYFDTMQMSINLFSTKASEALSLGVPLIVNESIVELAELVKTNECGIVFRVNEEGTILFDDFVIQNINSRDFWLNLIRNAFRVGQNYTFSNTVNSYLNYYYELVK